MVVFIGEFWEFTICSMNVFPHLEFHEVFFFEPRIRRLDFNGTKANISFSVLDSLVQFLQIIVLSERVI